VVIELTRVVTMGWDIGHDGRQANRPLRDIAEGRRRSGRLRHGSYALERRARGLELESRPFVPAFHPQCVTQTHACKARLIRSADVAPLIRCGFEFAAGGGRIPFGESNMSPGECRAGGHPAAVKYRRDAPELVCCRPRALDIAGS
jgi:hypothetical protein